MRYKHVIVHVATIVFLKCTIERYKLNIFVITTSPLVIFCTKRNSHRLGQLFFRFLTKTLQQYNKQSLAAVRS
jgi:hypothetical protein